MSQPPIVVVFVVALEYPPFDDAVLKSIEANLLMDHRRQEPAGIISDFLQVVRVIDVQPFHVHGIQGILHALEPVAGKLGDGHVTDDISPQERRPQRQCGGRLRPKVGKDQPSDLFHRISGNTTLLLEFSVRPDRFLERLLNTGARWVELPSVVRATESIILRDAVCHVDPAVRAEAVYQSQPALTVPEQHKVLT